MFIIQKDGTKEKYNSNRIFSALKKAALKIPAMTDANVLDEVNKITRKVRALGLVELNETELEDIIFSVISVDYPELHSSYINYKRERERNKILKSELMNTVHKVGIETDRDNANVGNNYSSKLLRIASITNKYYNLGKMPKNIAKLHEIGDLYYHDLDSYNLTANCLHIPTGRLLESGFNTGYGTIKEPKSIETAAILTCILLQSSQNDLYGGQSHPNFDNDLAPYVKETRFNETVEVLFERHLDISTEETLDRYEKLTRILGDKVTKWNIVEADLEDEDLIQSLIEIVNIVEEIKTEVNLGRYELTKKEKIKREGRIMRSTRQAMQNIVYNLNTMHSRAGSQVPFSSLNIGIPDDEDAALICRIFLEEYEKGLGKHEQPIFPNIIFRCKKGVNQRGDKHYDLFKLACRVAAKRMNPTFMNLDSSFNLKYYEKGIVPATMGCRTYVCANVNGPEGPESRGNNACTTIDLPRIALNTIIALGKDSIGTQNAVDHFMLLFNEKIEQAKDSLLHRFETLKKLRVKDIPFSAGQHLMMGSEGLGPDDSIEPILKNGTWGIGFIGLAETLKVLTGYHQGESKESRELGLAIVTHLRYMTDKYIKELGLNFSCYATPAEGLSNTFTKSDKERYGDIDWIISKGFYTNSYHVPVDYQISIKEKLEIEAPYHALCNGGHISYVELDGSPTGDVIETIVTGAYASTDISYIGINFHIRYCRHCGHYLDSHEGHTCPNCGSNDLQGVSRVTGYLSLDERFGPGKAAERSKRSVHSENAFGANAYNLK